MSTLEKNCDINQRQKFDIFELYLCRIERTIKDILLSVKKYISVINLRITKSQQGGGKKFVYRFQVGIII